MKFIIFCSIMVKTLDRSKSCVLVTLGISTKREHINTEEVRTCHSLARCAEESYAYEDEGQDWASEGVQPIHSVADMQIVLVAPQEYKDASKIADLLRDMKFVVLNLAKTERDVARRLLDFVSGVIYTEDGHIMKVATNVYVVAPYFVDLLGAPGESDELYF